jgi:tRNA/rRNA methyltransferase
MSESSKLLPLDHVFVILVRPSDPRNIGFVCRAMKTMGITNLRIVSAHPVNLKRAAVTSVHAKDLLSAAEVFPAIKAALADISLAAGITRRRGRMRKYYSLTPEEFAAHCLAIKKGRIALVFGTEEYGLTDEELSHCHLAVHIPSSPLFPSLNLSHAVQILCYALFREAGRPHCPRFTPLDGESRAVFVSRLIDYLRPLNYFKLAEPQSLSIFLNDIFARAALSKNESKRIETMFHKINGRFIQQTKKLKPRD